MKSKTALYCILNWGLGHATRSIPIIQELERQGWTVIIATDGIPYTFLKKQFPVNRFEKLPGYNINYKGRSIFWIISKQLHKMVRARIIEHKKVKEIVDLYDVKLVISDNRFGCYDKRVTSIFITHQWNLLASNLKIHRLATWLNQRMIINFFDKVWIPDDPELNMSGILSEKNPHQLYTGIISRFDQRQNTTKPSIDLLFIISGPEPLRTSLERKCITLASKLDNKNIHIVRGTNLPREKIVGSNIHIHDLVESDKLQELISQAKFIVSRSGYTSLMDYLHLGVQNLLLIPTPMQTEQEYLAEHLVNHFPYVNTTSEEELNLSHLQEGMNRKVKRSTPTKNTLLEKTVSDIELK